MDEPALAVGVMLLPVALVEGTIRPILATSAMTFLGEPLTHIYSPVFKFLVVKVWLIHMRQAFGTP
jgi:hypothetical protein